jgi:isocitrate dehydrogenase kinase/phosphatase
MEKIKELKIECQEVIIISDTSIKIINSEIKEQYIIDVPLLSKLVANLINSLPSENKSEIMQRSHR